MIINSLIRKKITKQSIHFIYAERLRYSGTTVMRGEQLSQIAQKALPHHRITFSPADLRLNRSVLFLTKGALRVLGPAQLEKLKTNRNRLIIDPVDAEIQPEKVQFVDTIVAASKTAYDTYLRLYPAIRIILVDHHADLRLKFIDWSKRPASFRVGYFGELVNTYATPAIKKLVDFVQVDTNNQNDNWFKRLPHYNLHYAIRQTRQNDNHKPFLKGFTAAFCGANILIQDSQEEAKRWLGEDYPFLIKGRVSESKIINALDKARSSFGSSEWRRGLEIMTDLNEKVSERAVGRQLVELFDAV